MNKLLNNIDIECKYCSRSNVLLSSNLQDKEYFLYFQNNNLSLFKGDDIGMEVLDEMKIVYCMFCGRELSG